MTLHHLLKLYNVKLHTVGMIMKSTGSDVGGKELVLSYHSLEALAKYMENIHQDEQAKFKPSTWPNIPLIF
jgi:hypothetical protein